MVVDLSGTGLVALDLSSPNSEAAVLAAAEERRKTGRSPPHGVPAGLRTLIAANNDIEALRAVGAACPNLRTLVLHDNRLTRLDTGELPRGLRVLDLAGNLLPSLDFVAALPFLASLDVSRNAIASLTIPSRGGGGGGGRQTFPHAPVLHTLICADNAVASLDGVADFFPALEVLDVARNPCVDHRLAAFDDSNEEDMLGKRRARRTSRVEQTVRHIRQALDAPNGVAGLPQLHTLTIGIVAAAGAGDGGDDPDDAGVDVDLAAAVLASVCHALPDLRVLDGVALDDVPVAGSADTTTQQDQSTGAAVPVAASRALPTAAPFELAPKASAPSSDGGAPSAHAAAEDEGPMDGSDPTRSASSASSSTATSSDAGSDGGTSLAENDREAGPEAPHSAAQRPSDDAPILPPRARVRIGPPSRDASVATAPSDGGDSAHSSTAPRESAPDRPLSRGSSTVESEVDSQNDAVDPAVAERLLQLASGPRPEPGAPSSHPTSLDAISAIRPPEVSRHSSANQRNTQVHSRSVSSVADHDVTNVTNDSALRRSARVEAMRARVAAMEADLFMVREESLSLAEETAELETRVAQQRKAVASRTNELLNARARVEALKKETEGLRFKASKRLADVAHAEMAQQSADTRRQKAALQAQAKAAEEQRNAARMRRIANSSIRQGLKARERDGAAISARRQREANAHLESLTCSGPTERNAVHVDPSSSNRARSRDAADRSSASRTRQLRDALEPESFRDFLHDESVSGLSSHVPVAAANDRTLLELAAQARLLEAAAPTSGNGVLSEQQAGAPESSSMPAEAVVELSPPRPESRRRHTNGRAAVATEPSQHRLPKVNQQPTSAHR